MTQNAENGDGYFFRWSLHLCLDIFSERSIVHKAKIGKFALLLLCEAI